VLLNDFLQEQSGFLSADTTRPLLQNVIEHILEDLNCYCECMSPISTHLFEQWTNVTDEANTINVKLFPVFRAPSPVKAYHVPICTVQLESLMDMNWDMTLQKVT
jgi:nitrogen permease regulator 2-like protein